MIKHLEYFLIMLSKDGSTTFMDNYFDFLPYDMQQEIIKLCYKRPTPKFGYGDIVITGPSTPQDEALQTYSEPVGDYWETERPNDASGIYCVMMNPIWKDTSWTWEYIIREFQADNSGYYSSQFLNNDCHDEEGNENYYLLDCAYIHAEHQLLKHLPETDQTSCRPRLDAQYTQ